METFFKGIPGSGGIAIGSAIVLMKSNIFIPKYTIAANAESVEKELAKLENALMKTRNQLEGLRDDLSLKHSALETGYIDTSILMLEDPLIKEKVKTVSVKNVGWLIIATGMQRLLHCTQKNILLLLLK